MDWAYTRRGYEIVRRAARELTTCRTIPSNLVTGKVSILSSFDSSGRGDAIELIRKSADTARAYELQEQEAEVEV